MKAARHRHILDQVIGYLADVPNSARNQRVILFSIVYIFSSFLKLIENGMESYSRNTGEMTISVL